MGALPDSQAVCLTFDCKCPSLGRQPFLIMRITLLSNRKITLNNTAASSWSQTAALRMHPSPVTPFPSPASTNDRKNIQSDHLVFTPVHCSFFVFFFFPLVSVTQMMDV